MKQCMKIFCLILYAFAARGEPMQHSTQPQWIEIVQGKHLVLIVKIADTTHVPDQKSFERDDLLAGIGSSTLYYAIICPAASIDRTIMLSDSGETELPRPFHLYSMLSSPQYVAFTRRDRNPDSLHEYLVFFKNRKKEIIRIDLNNYREQLQTLPFFRQPDGSATITWDALPDYIWATGNGKNYKKRN